MKFKEGLQGTLIVCAVLVLIVVISSLASANLGTFPQDSCVPIRVLVNSTSVNIIEVTANGNTTYVLNAAMTNLGGQTWNYTFCNTTQLGTYTYSWNPSGVDCSQGNCGNSFLITYYGNEPPSGIVITAFGIIFVLILGYLIYSMIYMIAHTFTLDFDMLDVAKTAGGYIMLLGLYMLEKYYLGNPDIHAWFTLFIEIGVWTHIVIPMFAFAFSLVVGQYARKKIVRRDEV